MDRSRLFFLLVNVVGGVGVIGSYVHGLSTHPDQAGLLWGTMPESLIPIYSGNMPFAAIGYLLTFAFLMLTPPAQLTRKGQPMLGWFTLSTLVFLLASTWWMPLCFQAIDTGDAELLKWIQLVLAVAGAAALGNFVQLLRLDTPPRPRLWRVATVGWAFLVLQCTVLDALVWPRFFGI